MAKYAKTLEEVIKSEIAHFHRNHSVPERLSDDCNQEIAIAVIQLYDKIQDRDPWYMAMRIRDATRRAGENFLRAEMIYETHCPHADGDDDFLCECMNRHVYHAAVYSSLFDAIKVILAETGFSERDSKIVIMLLKTSDEKRDFAKIGNQFGVTGNMARQIYFKAIHKFRNPVRSKTLKYYFDIL